MDFISATFVVFVMILSAVYFITPKKAKWVVLLLGSYVFYVFSSVKLLFFFDFYNCSNVYLRTGSGQYK